MSETLGNGRFNPTSASQVNLVSHSLSLHFLICKMKVDETWMGEGAFRGSTCYKTIPMGVVNGLLGKKALRRDCHAGCIVRRCNGGNLEGGRFQSRIGLMSNPMTALVNLMETSGARSPFGIVKQGQKGQVFIPNIHQCDCPSKGLEARPWRFCS